MLLVISPTVRGEAGVSYEFVDKALALLAPILFYGQELDLVILLVLAAFLAIALAQRAIHPAPAVVLPAAGLGLSVLLVPTWILGNWGNDLRLMAPLAFLVIAGIRLRPDRPIAILFVMIGVTLFSTRVATITNDWRQYDKLFDELRTMARTLEPGARVLPAIDDWSRIGAVAPTGYRYIFYNVPALLVLQRPVFVPTLFTAKNRQPLSVQPPFAAIDAPHLRPMPLDTLILAVDPEARREIYRNRETGEFHYRFAGWPKAFDYVLIFDFGVARNPLPGLLVPAASGSYFTLYAVAREDYATPRGAIPRSEAQRG